MSDRIFKKAALYISRLSASAGMTYLYIRWSVRQAYIYRGYDACGGEYLIIPFVFYGIFKVSGYLTKLYYAQKIRGGEKELTGDHSVKECEI